MTSNDTPIIVREDPVGDFIQSVCVITGKDNDLIDIADCYKAYQSWSRVNDEPALKLRNFKNDFVKHANLIYKDDDGQMAKFEMVAQNGIFFCGIQLREKWAICATS